MKRRVVKWLPATQVALKALYFRAGMDQTLIDASKRISERLRTNAEGESEPLKEGLRVIEDGRLRVVAEITNEHLVQVANVVLLYKTG